MDEHAEERERGVTIDVGKRTKKERKKEIIKRN